MPTLPPYVAPVKPHSAVVAGPIVGAASMAAVTAITIAFIIPATGVVPGIIIGLIIALIPTAIVYQAFWG